MLIGVPIVSHVTPVDYASKLHITSKENENAEWLDIDAAQYVETGTVSPLLPTKLMIKYISRYHKIATINPNKALVKNTLMNNDYTNITIQNSQ